MTFPRKCSACGVMTPEEGFHRDRSQPSGRKSRCKSCHRGAVKAYHDEVRGPRRQAALEAERRAEDEIRQREHEGRVRAVREQAEAGRRRQAKLLAELGVPDLSPDEVTRRSLRGEYLPGRAAS